MNVEINYFAKFTQDRIMCVYVRNKILVHVYSKQIIQTAEGDHQNIQTKCQRLENTIDNIKIIEQN